ncbi:MAG TPA: PEGA domain-containing protein, partial [Polyangia bacterium]|nr:PEGA domain-containing protein [Polyangia bacterium]
MNARADVAKSPSTTYALFRLDALGIAPEIVEQLERILRVEVERALGQSLPSRAAVDQAAAQNPKLAGCTADPACLAPLARALKASRVIAGNVGGLADSYVVNLKLVDEGGRELRRVSATLRGSPEELIDETRVAAYRLVAPERLVGAIAVLSDVPGAQVALDGQPIGQTPLAGALDKLSVGIHTLDVTREGFTPFTEQVPVRFEKTTQVVVRQSATTVAARRALARAGRTPIYARWYFWTGVLAASVLTGVIIGFAVPKQGAL